MLSLADSIARYVAELLRPREEETRFTGKRAKIIQGDCREILKTLPEHSADSMVTDPPSGVRLHYLRWDTFKSPASYVAFLREAFSAALPVLKPGAHALVYSVPKTSHLTAAALAQAGYEIRDVITHIYSGGPAPSQDLSKVIDREAGREGRYGAPKTPAHAFWIRRGYVISSNSHKGYQRRWKSEAKAVNRSAREYLPATAIGQKWKGWATALRPTCEFWILARKPIEGSLAANVRRHGTGGLNIDGSRVDGKWPTNVVVSRLPRKKDRANGNDHPASKDPQLLDHLIRLVTPPAGIVLDPFAGSASCGVAAVRGGWSYVGIERTRGTVRSPGDAYEASSLPPSLQRSLH